MLKIFSVPLTIVILLAVFLPGIIQEKTIVLGGSTSVYPLFDDNTKKTPYYQQLGWKINYNSMGSSAAFGNVKKGIFDIGFVSRNLSKRAKDDSSIKSFHIANDYMIMLYHLPAGCNLKGDSPKAITVKKQKLKAVFDLKQPNWAFFAKELADANYSCSETALQSKLSRINRENGSGTRTSFEKFFALGKKYKFEITVKSSNLLLKDLANTGGSITYVGLAYLTNKITKEPNNLGVFIFDNDEDRTALKQLFEQPLNQVATKFSDYSFNRPFNGFYLKAKQNEPQIQKFLEFIQSADFKKILIQEKRLSYEYQG